MENTVAMKEVFLLYMYHVALIFAMLVGKNLSVKKARILVIA